MDSKRIPKSKQIGLRLTCSTQRTMRSRIERVTIVVTTRTYCAPSARLVLTTGPRSHICNYYRRPLLRALSAALSIAFSKALPKSPPFSFTPSTWYVMRWDTKIRSASKKQYC